MIRRFALPLLLASGLVAACSNPTVEAPTNRGICWSMSKDDAGKYSFHRVASNVPNMEHCAANLEALRQKFLGLGGNRRELTGAYQGVFIFVRPQGIYTAPEYDRTPWLALVRTQDGRLVVPGLQSQPAP